MKIVFVASHSQKSDLGKYYKRIYEVLDKQKHTLYAGSLFLSDVNDLSSKESREKWYKTSIKEIQQSDLVVVEISYPSTANVGHLLTYAMDLGKTVLAFYRDGRDPLFLTGRSDDRLLLFAYTDTDLEEVVKEGLEYSTTVQDVRFNFFISPQIGTYLDWVSKNKRIPRAVYLRKLIEEEMRANKDYNESQ